MKNQLTAQIIFMQNLHMFFNQKRVFFTVKNRNYLLNLCLTWLNDLWKRGTKKA